MNYHEKDIAFRHKVCPTLHRIYIVKVLHSAVQALSFRTHFKGDIKNNAICVVRSAGLTLQKFCSYNTILAQGTKMHASGQKLCGWIDKDSRSMDWAIAVSGEGPINRIF